MQVYNLNVELSRGVYNNGRKQYHAKACYANVYRAVTVHYPQFASGNWKVAYGYMTNSVVPQLLIRHCFILADGGVIDPTVFATGQTSENRMYYTMRVFEDVTEYRSAVEKAGYYPELNAEMKPYEKDAYKWAELNGFVLCG